MENKARILLEKKRQEKESEIKDYSEKVAYLKVEINLIDELLKDLGQPPNEAVHKAGDSVDVGNPSERREDAIKLFHKVGLTLRTPDFETDFKNEFGHYKNMSNILRRLRRDGEIASVKYENQMQLVYHGLPEWIEGDDFKSEYKNHSYTDAERLN